MRQFLSHVFPQNLRVFQISRPLLLTQLLQELFKETKNLYNYYPGRAFQTFHEGAHGCPRITPHSNFDNPFPVNLRSASFARSRDFKMSAAHCRRAMGLIPYTCRWWWDQIHKNRPVTKNIHHKFVDDTKPPRFFSRSFLSFFRMYSTSSIRKEQLQEERQCFQVIHALSKNSHELGNYAGHTTIVRCRRTAPAKICRFGLCLVQRHGKIAVQVSAHKA